jgi:hypothetical protein
VSNCPKCHIGKMIELFGGNSNFKSAVCPKCAYYESDSEAFALYPQFFHDLGREILARKQSEACARGLTEAEAQAWLDEEPAFTRRIVTPLDNKRKGNSAARPPESLFSGLLESRKTRNETLPAARTASHPPLQMRQDRLS